jgi:glycosyltransferase involved in cell wall biosynthesis
MSQRVLMIGYVWPEPQSSAAGCRMRDLIQLFLNQHDSIVFASQAKQTPQMTDLTSMGVRCTDIQVNNSEFDQLLAEFQPELVVFDRYFIEEQFGWRVRQYCPDATTILETSDLHSLREARQYAHKQHRPISENDYYRPTAMREIASIYRCDLSLIISEVEMAHLQNSYGVDPALLHYIPLLVDINALEQQQNQFIEFEQRQDYLFIGNFRHPPNWDAVQYLHSCWSQWRRRQPDANVHIYGAYMPDSAKQLHQPQIGFHMHGWAEHVGEVMQASRINLAPLRFGAGMKGKLIDAMFYGTPSVCTSVAAEGIVTDTPWPGTITDDKDDFINAAYQLYHHKPDWQQAVQQGYDLLKQRHSYAQHGEQLIDALNKLQQNLLQHRRNNFTGAMLRHHRMNSTRYLSKWIEEKNKHNTSSSDISG